MNAAQRNSERLVELMPVLAAFAVHAIAHDRWMVAVPAGLALLVLVILDVKVQRTPMRLLAAGAVGVAIGLVMLVVNQPPEGPIPPLVLSPLTAMLIGLSGFCIIARQTMYAWVYAWVLVALSGNGQMSLALLIAIVVMMMVTLTGAAQQAGLLRAGFIIVLPLGFFAVITAFTTVVIATGAQALEGTLNRTLYAILKETGLPTGVGLSRDMTLSATSSIEPSMRPLMDLSTPPGRLRSQVLDSFDGERWTASKELRRNAPAFAEVPRRAGKVRAIDATFLDDLLDHVPSPAGTFEVRGARTRMESGWVLRGGVASGTTVTLVGDSDEMLPPEPEPGAQLLEVPEKLAAALGPTAVEVTTAGRTPREKAALLEAFLRDNFEYTLNTDLTGKDPPLVVMIRERRPAYCVYFASAMAVMLRTIKIHARVVGGFVPEEVNPITGRSMVRERDAHAWVEAWFPGDNRFVAFDPTPWRSRDRIMGLDDKPGALAAIVGAIRSAVHRAWLAVKNDPLGVATAIARSPLTWLALVAFAYQRLRHRRARVRAMAQRDAMRTTDPALERAYARYLKSLERAGVTPRPWETDEELIARLGELRGPVAAQAAGDFIARYRRARFRGEPVDETALQCGAV